MNQPKLYQLQEPLRKPQQGPFGELPWDHQAHQDAIDALGKAVDDIFDGDEAFFDQHPDRAHWVRRAHKVERLMHEIASGTKLARLSAGCRWYRAIKRVEGGSHKVLFAVPSFHHVERFSEAVCRAVWERVMREPVLVEFVEREKKLKSLDTDDDQELSHRP
jgi:hypothetical protein